VFVCNVGSEPATNWKLFASFPLPRSVPVSERVGVEPSEVVTVIFPTVTLFEPFGANDTLDKDNPVIVACEEGVIEIVRFF
jgi:hypothetical protein